jgi:hypothetical protein
MEGARSELGTRAEKEEQRVEAMLRSLSNWEKDKTRVLLHTGSQNTILMPP